MRLNVQVKGTVLVFSKNMHLLSDLNEICIIWCKIKFWDNFVYYKILKVLIFKKLQKIFENFRNFHFYILPYFSANLNGIWHKYTIGDSQSVSVHRFFYFCFSFRIIYIYIFLHFLKKRMKIFLNKNLKNREYKVVSILFLSRLQQTAWKSVYWIQLHFNWTSLTYVLRYSMKCSATMVKSCAT